MIELHRLGHQGDMPFQLNPDLVVSVEAVPDTTIVLATGARVVVSEAVEQVIAEIRDWRVSILTEAFGRIPSNVVALR